MDKKLDQPPKDEVSKALQVLAEDRARRMDRCMAEIQTILDKYGFDIVVTTPSISLVPHTQE
ncbi:MAG TPA: hypothetical protein VFO38_00310 [Candidatus Saccharimonadales bacterium]|nr:hypothetical protein [Candidatus Saccharimonadales bacterium]